MTRKHYEEDLKERQKRHLDLVRSNREQNNPWKPCAHDECPTCHGTGVKLDGSTCVHYISCTCPKCQPLAMTASYPTSEWKIT
jgi:DnaJ-class molecular chaperone